MADRSTVPSVWLAADGEHVQFHHVCNGEPKVDTLPNSVWPVPPDGHVKPSIHCTDCGFHDFLTLVPRPVLMDAIEGVRRVTSDTPRTEADPEGVSRAFAAMRREVESLRGEAIAKEAQHAGLHGAGSPNGWSGWVAAYEEVLSAIDELEELT